MRLWQLSIFTDFFFVGGFREVFGGARAGDAFFRDPFQLPSNGAALGIEVEMPRDKNAPLVFPYQGKRRLLLPTRDADCLAESAFFRLECDGSHYNPGKLNSQTDALKAAVAGYIGLMDDTEGQTLIDGTWNGANSQKEEATHWGYGCLIEIVGQPLSTDPGQVDLQVDMLTAVGQIQAAIEETIKGDDRSSWTLANMLKKYNKMLSQKKKASGWKLALPCQKHQRRIPQQSFSLQGTPWAVPTYLGQPEDADAEQKGLPLPIIFEGNASCSPPHEVEERRSQRLRR